MHLRNETYILLALLIICYIYCFSHNACNTRSDINSIVKGIEKHSSLVKSGKGSYALEYTVTEFGAKKIKEIKEKDISHSLRRTSDITCYFEGDKFRFNVFTQDIQWLWWNPESQKEVEYKTYTEYIYDGETAVTKRYRSKDIIASLANDPKNIMLELDTVPWDIKLFGEPLAKALKTFSSKVVGVQNLNGESDYVIIVNPPNELTGGSFFKIWINPKKGYSMERLEAFFARDIKPAYILTIDFKEYSKGIWFPSTIIRTNFDDENKNKKEFDKTTVKVKDFQINIDIPDDIFKPTYQKGTIVHDTRTDKTYTVR